MLLRPSRRFVAGAVGLTLVLTLVGAVTAASSRSETPPRDEQLARATPTASTTTTTTAPATTTTAAPTTTTSAAPRPAGGPAASPAELAARIAEAERMLHDPALDPAGVAAWSHAQQVAYRQVVHHPEWRDAVRSHVPADVREAFEINLAAGANLRAMHKRLRTELPRWRIITPRPSGELVGYYQAAEAEFGVPWPYLAAINLVETRMGRIIGLSSAGAQGPMQFMPATWAAYGEGDVNDPADAIRGAARYLAANGAPHDMDNALWNYNHDTRYVEAVKLYAQRMAADPLAYRAYHGWQVIYLTAGGDVLLHEGWVHPEGEVTG